MLWNRGLGAIKYFEYFSIVFMNKFDILLALILYKFYTSF